MYIYIYIYIYIYLYTYTYTYTLHACMHTQYIHVYADMLMLSWISGLSREFQYSFFGDGGRWEVGIRDGRCGGKVEFERLGMW